MTAPAVDGRFLDAALAYAARGWSVFPIKARAKTPLTEHGFKDASLDAEQVRAWWARWPSANVGVACGASGLVVLDVDPRGGGDMSFGDLFPTEPGTVNAFTGGGGRHFYFAGDAPCRVVAPGLDLKGVGGYVVAPPSVHPSGEAYLWEASSSPDLMALAPVPDGLRNGARPGLSAEPLPDVLAEGGRNSALASLAGSMRRRGASPDAIAAALHEENRTRCMPPLDEREVEAIALSVGRYTPAAHVEDLREEPVLDGEPETYPWPTLDRDAALIGVAGDFVKLHEPHTEADSAAMLVQFLTGFGNLIGRCAFWTTGADDHYSNLYTLVVGKTAIARKGTSWGFARRLFRAVDPDWRLPSGLSTGEGLIWSLHDEIKGKEYDKKEKEYVEVVKHEAVADKRLLVVEPEFSRVLRVMARKENTLREVVSQAWESGDLELLTKVSAAKATDAHVSIIGHITLDTLRRFLDEQTIASGFANRFLIVCARRRGLLPFGGSPEQENVAPLVKKITDAQNVASYLERVDFDDEATRLWERDYARLTQELPGMFGSLVTRAAPIVRRLALIYCALDQWRDKAPKAVTAEHLRAALAVWDYAEQSARYIFGATLGDPDADRILRALRQRSDGRMNRNAIHELFSGHRTQQQTDRALAVLVERNLVCIEEEATGGRPATWVRLTR